MVKLKNEEIDWLKKSFRKTLYNSISGLERVSIMVEETGLSEDKVRAYLLDEFDYSEPIVESEVSIEITFSTSMKIKIDRSEETEEEFLQEMKDKFYNWFNVNHDISIRKMSDVGEDIGRMSIENISINNNHEDN